MPAFKYQTSYRTQRRSVNQRFFDAVYCRIYVTTMKAMTFPDIIASIPFEYFRDHYVMLFDLISRQKYTENFQFSELDEEPLMIERIFTFLSENVFVFIEVEDQIGA